MSPCMIPTLVLAIALGVETPAAPSPDELARLNRTFERAREVRIVTLDRGFFVRSPQAAESGLDYRSTSGFPLRRPAIAAGGWDTIAPPPRPVPWPAIQRIEWTHGGATAGWIAGTVGVALLLGGVVVAVSNSHSDVGPSVPSVLIGSAAGGALIGFFVADPAKKTEIVYPPAAARKP